MDQQPPVTNAIHGVAYILQKEKLERVLIHVLQERSRFLRQSFSQQRGACFLDYTVVPPGRRLELKKTETILWQIVLKFLDIVVVAVKEKINHVIHQFTTLLAQLLLAKASGLALNANPIPNI
jgi:hypothetical protein